MTALDACSVRRRSRNLPFDAQPVPGAKFDDLDLYLFERSHPRDVLNRDVPAADGRTVTERLSALRLITMDGVPTNTGIMVLGIDPTEFLPGAYLQFLRIDGTDLTAPIIYECRLTTALPFLLRELDELLRLNIRTSVRIGDGLRDQRQPDYPLVALQQLTRNAILHRSYEGTSPVRLTWYTDRVEIYSPGGPYGAVTVGNFGRPGVTDCRNPNLAEMMRGLDHLKKLGAGLPIAHLALKENGNPPAEFTADPAYVGVVVRETQRGFRSPGRR